MRHAPTSATRTAAFPADEPLDYRGRAAAAALGAAVPKRCQLMSSPALRCRETAVAAGLAEPQVEPDLAECDFGSWAGRTLVELSEADPKATRDWMLDPHSRAHGGESLHSFAGRVGDWLDAQAGLDGPALAITHGGVVKAALVRALDAPLAAFWRIDATPLAITELHAHDGRWTITRVNCPLAKKA